MHALPLLYSTQLLSHRRAATVPLSQLRRRPPNILMRRRYGCEPLFSPALGPRQLRSFQVISRISTKRGGRSASRTPPRGFQLFSSVDLRQPTGARTHQRRRRATHPRRRCEFIVSCAWEKIRYVRICHSRRIRVQRSCVKPPRGWMWGIKQRPFQPANFLS